MKKEHKPKNKNWVARTAGTAALVLMGITCGMASQLTQGDPSSVGQVDGSGCPGTYYAVAKMTNSTGSFWLTPPSGTTNGIFKDVSGFPPPYSSSVQVGRRSDQMTWCSNGASGVSFPASTSTSYSMAVYVTSKSPPPTNNQSLTLQITWH